MALIGEEVVESEIIAVQHMDALDRAEQPGAL
jgi:hypothetical protein